MLKRSTDSNRAAVPLEVTSTLLPSGEIAAPQGPASPGPVVTVVCVPAGVSVHPVGVIAAAGGASARAVAPATTAAKRPRVKDVETIDSLLCRSGAGVFGSLALTWATAWCESGVDLGRPRCAVAFSARRVHLSVPTRSCLYGGGAHP